MSRALRRIARQGRARRILDAHQWGLAESGYHHVCDEAGRAACGAHVADTADCVPFRRAPLICAECAARGLVVWWAYYDHGRRPVLSLRRLDLEHPAVTSPGGAA